MLCCPTPSIAVSMLDVNDGRRVCKLHALGFLAIDVKVVINGLAFSAVQRRLQFSCCMAQGCDTISIYFCCHWGVSAVVLNAT